MKEYRLALISGKKLSVQMNKAVDDIDTQTITGYEGVVPKCLTIPEEIEGTPVLKIGLISKDPYS